jgi:two-component system sensor histidine kinase BaeS
VGPAGERKVRITVEDRGPGIPASELPHLFEPFFRGAEAVSSQTRGSGLGLSLVKRIVDAHGGTVDVKTSPGRGSAFTIVLPAVAETCDEPTHSAG